MKEKFLTKGNIALFCIALVLTIVTGLVCHLCGCDRITTVAASPMGGIVGLLIIGGLFEITDMKAPMGPEPGILGIVLGTIISLIVF